MEKSTFRVLLVDDSEPWRNFFSSALQKRPELEVIGRASDGLEAVQQAQELQPDLILLDIGLPTLNGIEAARRIRKVSPGSTILFVSENRSADIAEAALSTGAGGYVVKSDAASELLPAVKAVLEGKRFVSASLADHGLNGLPDPQTGARFRRDNVVTFTELQNAGITRHHEVGFYSNDRLFLDDLTLFVGSALKAGNAAIVAACESHRDSLLQTLHRYGLDMGKAIEEGRYIGLDAADGLSQIMLEGVPDPVRFMTLFDNLILKAANAARSEHPRVVIFGECVHLLWAQGNPEAAIQMEKLGNLLTKTYDVNILCGYSLNSVQGGMDDHIFQRICAEHSKVYSR